MTEINNDLYWYNQCLEIYCIRQRFDGGHFGGKHVSYTITC